MDEEKKTTTKSATTKSSAEKTTAVKKTAAKKKEVVEEVKVEKRFCTNCGKELGENETCTCASVSVNNSTNINTDAILDACKGFINKVVNMFKKPAETLKDEVSKNNVKYALVMLAVIAITYGLYILGALSIVIDGVNNLAEDAISPFKVFLYMSIIYFVISFIPIVITFVVSKIVGCKDFDFKKSISLYAFSQAPMIFANLLMALLYWIDILSWLGVIVGCIVSLSCFFHYILGYIDLIKVPENKKSYTITGVLISWVVVAVLVAVLFVGGLFQDVIKNQVNNNYDNIYDSFDW